MNIEYEATFIDIDKDNMRNRLVEAGAKLVKKEFMQKRTVFRLPKGDQFQKGWGRVRDEGDKITMSIKNVEHSNSIHGQKEICLIIDNYDEGCNFFESLGCVQKAYQESLRELWVIDNVEITIDTWPFLYPLVEVEGESEIKVRQVSEKIGFIWGDAKFCAAGTLYAQKYDISEKIVNSHTPKLIFEMKNPFLK